MNSMDLINHLFLPRKLPGSQDDAGLVEFEKYLLNQFSAFLAGQHPKLVFGEDTTKELAEDFLRIQKLFTTWNTMQGLPRTDKTKETTKSLDAAADELTTKCPPMSTMFSKNIVDLLPGESFAFYVREQNAALLITRIDSRYRLSPFITSQSNVSIFGSDSDLAAEFPGSCVEVPLSRVLQSDLFAEDILSFCSTPYSPAMKTSRKAGHEFVEVRDVVHPMLVTRYATCALADQESRNCGEAEFQRITKKIRDQVVWEKALKPFRRSGMWMSLKVILQLELVNRFGADRGLLLYKLLLLGFIKTCCTNECLQGQRSDDLALQMISKVSRRLAKVSVLISNIGLNYASHVSVLYFHNIRNEVHETVGRIRKNLETNWNRVVGQNCATVRPIMVNNVDDSIRHQLTNSASYLFQDVCSEGSGSSTIGPPPSRTRFRMHDFGDLQPLFPKEYLTSTKDEQLLGLILHDFERYIFDLPQEFVTVGSCRHFFELLESYIAVAKAYYDKDPVGGSRMVLTGLKIVQLLDVLAVNRYPLLGEYNSGIKESILHDVLMPFKRNAVLLEELEAYFRSRNAGSKLTSLVEATSLTENAFSVRFAQDCPEMIALREEILAEIRKEIEKKKAELESERERCVKLRRERANCSCDYTKDRWGDRVHSSYCTRCNLERQINACQVSRYEKTLPERTYEQNGVVFELLIPIEIACLRDALFVFSKEICSGNMTSNVDVQGRWTEGIYNLNRRHVNRHQKYILLVSTTKATLTSHYGSPLHVDHGDHNFILNNGFQCSFGLRDKTLDYSKAQSQVSAKKFCTFTVESGSTYSDMQWTLESTGHSQNKVLATQCNCPPNLSLAEYKEFGSLRVSHRLQYRNILRAIATESLSFREVSVLSLICQATWEAGPGMDGHFYREAHEDVSTDHHFTNELLTVLDQFLEKNRDNWNDQYILLLVILLSNRIRSMSVAIGSEKCTSKAADLILKCREVALNWTAAIEKLLSNSSSTQTSLRMKLVQVAAFGALTFTADNHITTIAPTADSLSQWLLFIAKIEDNILLTDSSLGSLPALTRNLIRWVRCVGVDLEAHFHSRPDKTIVLQKFSTIQWSGGSSSGSDSWTRCAAPSDQWYSAHVVGESGANNFTVLQMDIILGSFLVNGQPIGRLPREITHHALFQRLFSGLVFVVQNASGGGYVTKDKYYGCTYKFHLAGSELILNELGPDGEEFRLVPHDKFEGDVPVLLVSEHSHWKHKTKKIVQFRPKDFQNPGSDFSTEVKYELRLESRTLHETVHDKPMVDIRSKLYGRVSEVMTRLEEQEYIHVFLEPSGGGTKKGGSSSPVLSIELPRMGFHFYVTAQGTIMSNEYRGYAVNTTQGFGTLIGLRHGLLLTCDNCNPVVFIPHGTPKRNGDQTVTIERTKLRTPAILVFEVDETLLRPKAQSVQCAWLYLAHLHALTSGVLPDPFPGLTGTESAIQLLQSPLCWSGEPLDKESLITLRSIESLSPTRRFYPPHLQEMETVRWPSGLPSSCAHEAYVFIVRKLRADSKRIAFAFASADCHDDDGNEEQKSVTNLKLARRAYWKSATNYSPQAQINPEFDSEFAREPKCSSVSSLSLNSAPANTGSYDASDLCAVRLFADLGEKWTLPLEIQPELLTQTICNTSKVHPPCVVQEFQGGFDDRIQIKLVENWLGLYNYARKVVQCGMQVPWTCMLTSMAFGSGEHEYGQLRLHEKLIEHLKMLHAVAIGHENFEDLNPPALGTFTNTNEDTFNRNRIESTIRSSMRSFSDLTRSYGESVSDFDRRERDARCEHNETVNKQVRLILDHLQSTYGALKKNVHSCNIQSLGSWELSKVDGLSSLNGSIKIMLQCWYRNRKLKKFVGKVEARLRLLYTNNVLAEPKPQSQLHELSTKVNTEALDAFASRIRFSANNFWTEVLESAHPSPTSGWSTVVQPKAKVKARERANAEGRHMMSMLRTLEKSKRNPSGIDHNSHAAQNHHDGDEYPLRFDTNGVAKCDEILDEYGTDLSDSWTEYMRRRWMGSTSDARELDTHRAIEVGADLRARATARWKELLANMQLHEVNLELNTLQNAGLLFRPTPTTLLPLLLPHARLPFPGTLKHDIEELAIIWTQQQKVRRCLRFASAGRSMHLALSRELATVGFENWSPREKPEWLLLQLEMDLIIRPVQVDVAEQMAKSAGAHSLMQLNMGEGKTSVIIPMLASRLATGSQLARVTVLKSLYNTNKKMLAYSIGGLLNQRVYTFPCRRDLNFNADNIRTTQALYQECMAKRGVVMTVPEFRLSFQLKSYDTCRSSDLDTAKALLYTNSWLRQHARDILDECDEILNVKYQLIYTIGEQQQVGGGPNRWTTTQRLLRILPKHLKDLREEQLDTGISSGIEMQYSDVKDETQNGFPHCRILNDKCYPELCKRITMDLLEGRTDVQMPEIPIPVEANKALLMEFLTKPVLDRASHDAAMKLFEPASLTNTTALVHLNTILTLRGLLAYGVLLHALTRRWRVNYGVNPKGPKKMAVPFRAKDVSSERTEFGHTDVAILLTQFSYYYSGLSTQQVLECFTFLDRFDDKELQYRNWINGVQNLDPSLASLKGINLEDSEQTNNKTIPTLRKNTRVIDFWLSNAVYPKESKQFPYKLTCTPWDLCTTEMKHPVTGFSGTNDTKLLLPLTISQDDLSELKGTNGEVLFNLLKPENDNYSMLPLGITGKEVLKKLVQADIPLLLDVGAIMIDLSNSNVAKEWLTLVDDDKYKAALYFNDSDEIMIVDREGRATPFNLSPYRASLDVCLIYLDDVHTRGTDLKIPRGTKGCVTLGKGVTKDKLVQGCMRMRMLGNGHTVAFYASHEVDIEIRSIAPSMDRFGVKEVVLWALNNSCVVTRDGFHHWMSAAANFYTKTSANLLYEESSKLPDDMRLLERMCREDEVLELADIYGSFRNEESFHLIADRRMKAQAAAVQQLVPISAQSLIQEQFDAGAKKVLKSCHKYTKNVKRLTNMLDEEQERELENEQEEERQKERPGPATPVDHHLARGLLEFIKGSSTLTLGESEWCVSTPLAFQNTKIWPHAQPNAWGRSMYATKDFCQVVKHEIARGVGDYIRPLTWFVSKTNEKDSENNNSTTTLLLLSPFEANAVKNFFKVPGLKNGTYLHMFTARLHPDHSTFWETPTLTLPSSGHPISVHHHQFLNANLLIFSGSLFFKDEAEQRTYCNMLGFVPTPRNDAEEKAFKDGFVRNGWLLPEFEGQTGTAHPDLDASISEFNENPEQLVQSIVVCRHEALPESSHVSKILMQSKKTFMY